MNSSHLYSSFEGRELPLPQSVSLSTGRLNMYNHFTSCLTDFPSYDFCRAVSLFKMLIFCFISLASFCVILYTSASISV